MSLLNLNHDVLSMIMQQLSPRDCKNLSETSWFGRSQSVPYLLANVVITTKQIKRSRSLFAFILRDADARSAYLHRLTITSRSPHIAPSELRAMPVLESELVQVLIRAQNLRILVLRNLPLFKAGDELAAAIRALPKLSSATFVGATERYHLPEDLFTGLKSRALRTLTITGGLYPWTFDLLSPLQDSLESLSIHVPLNLSPRSDSFTPLGLKQWRSLHTLVLNSPEDYHNGGPELVQAFPNLRNLDVAFNAQQHVTRSDVTAWPSLDRVRGTWESLLNFQLSCPVRCLEILRSLPRVRWSVEDTGMRKVVGLCLPAVFILHTDRGRGYDFYAALSPVMRCTKLLHVSIVEDIRSETPTQDIIRGVVDACAARPLVYIGLRFQGFNNEATTPARTAEQLCRPFAATSVRYVELARPQPSWWELTRDGGGAVVEYLPLEPAEGLRIKERLVAELR